MAAVQKCVGGVASVSSFKDFEVQTLAACEDFFAIGGKDGLIEVWTNEPHELAANLDY